MQPKKEKIEEKENAKKKEKEKKKAFSIGELASVLASDPSESNWGMFCDALKESNAKYYKIFYEGLKNREDLTKSFARLYDARLRPIAKIPIIKRKGRSIEGATICLKDLKSANVFG